MMTDRRHEVREDAIAKVTGQATYVSDVTVPGMLHGKVLRSTVPHGRIVRIDAARALAMDGVVAVLTGQDLAGLDAYWGLFLRDRPVIAIDKVRYVGDPVAAVAAVDERTAEEAVDAIDVEYEALPFVTDPEEAARPGAPLIHDRFDLLEDFYFKGKAKPVPGTNIFQHFTYRHGDPDAALAGAHRVFEDTFTFPMVYHYAMEPYTVIAAFEGDALTVWSCAQAPGAVQKVLARIFGIPQARVRVIVPYIGGGFGSKASVKIDPLVAALAWKARRPVRVRFSIQESMLTSRRLAARCTIRTGVRADGTIVAKTVRFLMDGGAYADTGAAVAMKAATRCIGPYRIPNLSLESVAVYTNTIPGAAFRSIGGPQAVWAAESHMDIVAEGLGIDPIELRYRNLARKGDHIRPDLRPLDVDLGEALGIVTEALSRPEDGDGAAPSARGIALAATDPGGLPLSSATVRLKIDGSVLVLSMSVEMGQGVRTVLGGIAADVLGVPRTAVTVATPDTLTAPFDWGTGASRSTVIMGLAVEQAALDVTRQVIDLAVEVLGMERTAVTLAGGGVTDGRRSVVFHDLFHAAFGIDSGEIVGHALITPRSFGGRLAQPPAFWETAAGGCALAVDADTGHIRVKRYVSEFGITREPPGEPLRCGSGREVRGAARTAPAQGAGPAPHLALPGARSRPRHEHRGDGHLHGREQDGQAHHRLRFVYMGGLDARRAPDGPTPLIRPQAPRALVLTCRVA
jgi:CO/xanthine dehydrogenase Mo-binding subunit